jgi:hypothetical protein
MASAERQICARSGVGIVDVEDGDRGCVSACLVCCGVEVSKLGVGDSARVDAECLGVGPVEPFDERFGGECPAAGRAGFDPRGLVYFVAEGGDFASSGCEDSPDVQRRAPMESEPQ